MGKVFSREELERIGELCVRNRILIVSDEVYDRLYYVPFTRIATVSKEVADLTLTVGSAGKNFYATGWRIGFLIGPANLIQYVRAAHTRICFSTPAPLQAATAIGFEKAEKEGFWDESRNDLQRKMNLFCEIFDELDIPVSITRAITLLLLSAPLEQVNGMLTDHPNCIQYSVPEGGYFVLANLSKVKIPEGHTFPPHVASRPRDFQLSWFLIHEVGVATIPPTEFYTPQNAHIAQDYVRFAVCKNDDILETAKERLKGLKAFISA